MKRRTTLLVLAILMSLLLAACVGSQPDSAGTDSSASEATATTATSSQDGSAAVATKAPVATKPSLTPKSTPTTEATTDSSDDGGTASTGNSAGIKPIMEVEDITSFRQRMSIQAEGEAFQEESLGSLSTMTLMMEFTRDPEEAYHITMELPDAAEGDTMGMGGTIEIIQIGNVSYVKLGESWIQGGDEGSMDMDNLTDLTFSDADAVSQALEQMETVGTEEINGRSTTHYRGTRDAFANLAEQSGDDSAQIDEAQMDVWVDSKDMFVVKMTIDASGTGLNESKPDAAGRMVIEIEVYDINAGDIVIEAPEVGSGLSDMLGFDLQLPDGASVDFAMAGMASITFPGTVEEAGAFITDQMTANGYTLDEDASSPEFGSYSFTQGDSSITVMISESDGQTSITFLGGSQ